MYHVNTSEVHGSITIRTCHLDNCVNSKSSFFIRNLWIKHLIMMIMMIDLKNK